MTDDQIDDQITAKVCFEEARKARRGTFGVDRPAGWVVYNPETGKNLTEFRYPTEQAALDAMPSLVAAYQRRVAEWERRMAETAAQSSGRPYDVVDGGFYGPGRRYHDQPGATQYDDGSGRYNTQIWDNA